MSKTRKRNCGRCPKRNAHGVCVHLGQWISSLHPPCDYGLHMMSNAYAAAWMRKKHGSKPRTPKPPPTNQLTTNDE